MPASRFTLGRSFLACFAGALLATLGACKPKSNHDSLSAPAITTQPQSQNVLEGQTATFTVVATGTAPLAYQWSKNGAAIDGATSASYTTPATTAADHGAVFRVTVTNDEGNVTSDPATLSVSAGYYIYRDGVVAQDWQAKVWHACGVNDGVTTNATFAGQTVASFDTSCWNDGWDAGNFEIWSSAFDLTPYDTLSFDIGAASTTGMGSLEVWADTSSATVPIGTVTAGELKHVEVQLSAMGLTGKAIHQLGWFYKNSGNGPLFYVNNVAVSSRRPTTPPAISALALAHAESYSATITFTTDREATDVVTAQADGGPAIVSGERAAATAHTFTIESLEPATLYHVSVVATDAWGLESAPATIDITTAAAGSLEPDVTVTVDPALPSVISPWIYGINGGIDDGNPNLFTFDRSGGNRLTAYNWENNFSNAGSDYQYNNDDYLLRGDTTPAEMPRRFIESNLAAGAASLVTFQLQGYVSADKDGKVDVSGALADRLGRFKQVVAKKPESAGPFTLTPPTDDAYVYMDEFAWALDKLFDGKSIFGASTARPTFISLDNEPDLWNSTHKEVQGPNPISSDAFIAKTVEMASALKDQFPGVKIFGPVNYGFGGVSTWQGEAGLGGAGDWFFDKYVKAMKVAEAQYGAPLVDVYDFHWYSESYDPAPAGKRVTDLGDAVLTDTQIQAVVQSPRSLWDTTFSDSTDWISRDALRGPIYILPRLKQKLADAQSSMKLAITEYDNGGSMHIAGTIALADDLGIFGAQGVFAANFWPPGHRYDYSIGGFRAFRGFDGAQASFGDLSVPATSTDVSKVAVYASRDSAVSGRLVYVAINRSPSLQKVSLADPALAGSATLYRMTAASAAVQSNAGVPIAPVLVGTQPVSGTSMLVVLPPLSVTTIEVK